MLQTSLCCKDLCCKDLCCKQLCVVNRVQRTVLGLEQMNAAIVNGLARAVIANGQAPKTLFILFSPDLSAYSFHLFLCLSMNVCLSMNPFISKDGI